MAFGLNRDFRSYCVESQCCADLGFHHEHFDAPTSHNFCIVRKPEAIPAANWWGNRLNW